MTMPHGLAVAVLMFALAGCATAEPAPPGAPGTSSPTPTATQARETGLTAPAQPFGGDCSALMSDAEASEIFGVDAHLSQNPFSVSYGGPRVTVTARTTCTSRSGTWRMPSCWQTPCSRR